MNYINILMSPESINRTPTRKDWIHILLKLTVKNIIISIILSHKYYLCSFEIDSKTILSRQSF